MQKPFHFPAEEVQAQYALRGFDRLSDAQLLRDVSNQIAIPRQEPGGSFVLHAPLELAARGALLPQIAPEARTTARMCIVAIAARYNSFAPVETNPEVAVQDRERVNPIQGLLEAMESGNLDATDRMALRVSSIFTPTQLIAALTPALISSTAAAAHAPIFLYHLQRRDSLIGLNPALLRPLARSLARNPTWRIRWTEGWLPSTTTDPKALTDSLLNHAKAATPESTSIHPLLMAVDESKQAVAGLKAVVAQYNQKAAQAILRGAAWSMLLDDKDHGPYGWSHALTMPQAVLGITEHTKFADLGLAIASTHLAAFRNGLGRGPIEPGDQVSLPMVDPTQLATQAATRNDAHVVKYILACLDAAQQDPQAARLFLAAGQKLLTIWDDLGGDGSHSFGGATPRQV